MNPQSVADFTGRSKELAQLNKLADSGNSQLVPIYGRRRVGKTELILRFLKNRKGLFYLGKESPAPLQIQDFLRHAAGVLDEPLLEMIAVEDWKTALRTVVSKRPTDKGPFVLVLDEFQWMANTSPDLPSILQELWDHEWKKAGDIFLILCGSYLGFMEREVLGSKSPLFGRRTAQILLRPFDYQESALFHPRLSLPDRARVYFLCGGIPYYLRFFSDQESVAKGIRENFLNVHAALYREPEFLLREELRELQNYHAILTSIANGSLTAKEISKRGGIPERSLPYYMNNLIELGYVARRYPLTGKKANTRNVHFTIEDAVLRFWFRFVFPNTSRITRLGPAASYQKIVAPELDSYFGLCFERLCQEALPNLLVAEGNEEEIEVGEYWDKNSQIDLVAHRSDGEIDLAECKWGTIKSWPKLRDELQSKVSAYPNPNNLTIRPRLFTRQKPSASAAKLTEQGIAIHSLSSLYPDG